jgi:hypothetical protein
MPPPQAEARQATAGDRAVSAAGVRRMLQEEVSEVEASLQRRQAGLEATAGQLQAAVGEMQGRLELVAQARVRPLVWAQPAPF